MSWRLPWSLSPFATRRRENRYGKHFQNGVRSGRNKKRMAHSRSTRSTQRCRARPRKVQIPRALIRNWIAHCKDYTRTGHLSKINWDCQPVWNTLQLQRVAERQVGGGRVKARKFSNDQIACLQCIGTAAKIKSSSSTETESRTRLAQRRTSPIHLPMSMIAAVRSGLYPARASSTAAGMGFAAGNGAGEDRPGDLGAMLDETVAERTSGAPSWMSRSHNVTPPSSRRRMVANESKQRTGGSWPMLTGKPMSKKSATLNAFIQSSTKRPRSTGGSARDSRQERPMGQPDEESGGEEVRQVEGSPLLSMGAGGIRT
ncbi:hypothetical protein B0H16DRAFT_705587, partial [Mycena metata]